MALLAVDARQVAAVVTHLEMRERPKPAPLPPSPFRLTRWKAPALDKYRILFRRVGEPWLWFSRLALPDAETEAIIHDDAVEIYAICDRQGIEVGMLELDFRTPGECAISFLGLIPQLTGHGHGRWLMSQVMMLGWRKGIKLLSVHSCSLDHPAALPLYIKSGFTPVRREIEIFDDPRLTGHLPRDAAPQIPLIG